MIGHELAAEVVELGEGTSGFDVGDRVQSIAAVPDGTCVECQTTAMTVCKNLRAIGYNWDGAFAEFMVVPEAVLKVEGLAHIPESLSYVEASVAEPLACALNGQELARVGERGG